MESPSTINRPFILNIYKPPGRGSTKVVGQIKRALGKSVKKIGHFGTLDPFAEGVLLIGGNGACRLNDYLHERFPKTYLAHGKFGEKTSTGDLDGEVVETQDVPKLSETQVEEVLNSFLGEYFQRPPAFSATKHEGKALYEYAREGIEIEKDLVRREIKNIELVELKGDQLQFRVTATTGTYIRTLFEDVAQKLGTNGHLIGLKREAIGPLNCSDSLLEERWPDTDAFEMKSFLDLRKCFDAPCLVVQDRELKLFSHGNPVEYSAIGSDQALLEGDMAWMADVEGTLLGLAKLVDGKMTSCFNFPYTPR